MVEGQSEARCNDGAEIGEALAAAEPCQVPAVAFRWLPFQHPVQMRHRFSLFREPLPSFAAAVGLAVERLRDRRGTAHAAKDQNLDVEFAGIGFYTQHIANVHLARRLDGMVVALDSAEFAGASSNSAGLEESRRPKPFVDSEALTCGHQFVLYRWRQTLCLPARGDSLAPHCSRRHSCRRLSLAELRSDMEPENKLDLLLGFVRSNGRICPQPWAWQRLFNLLPQRTPSDPAPPYVGDSWHGSNDLHKVMRLIEHIQWGAEHGAFREVNNFLRSLPEKDWFHGED